MNKINRMTVQPQLEEVATPRLEVVTSRNGVPVKQQAPPPIVLLSALYQRKPRPEVEVLGWNTRATRLAVRGSI